MGRAIEIIDPEGERRLVRRRRILLLAILASLCLFGYPVAQDYLTKWSALRAAREFTLYLSTLKTNAILRKQPMEARFKFPDEIEVYQVSSCGPHAERSKVESRRLGEFAEGVQFAPEPWVRENSDTREPYLPRFCYDPMFGSSIHADGLVHGGIFLAHRLDLETKRGDHLVEIQVDGLAGDFGIQ